MLRADGGVSGCYYHDQHVVVGLGRTGGLFSYILL